MPSFNSSNLGKRFEVLPGGKQDEFSGREDAADLAAEDESRKPEMAVDKKLDQKPETSRINYTDRSNPDGTRDFVARAATGEQIEINFLDGANLEQIIHNLMAAIQKTEELKIEEVRESISGQNPSVATDGSKAEFDIEAIQKELKEMLGALRELQQEKEMVEIDPSSFARAEHLNNLVRTEGHNSFYFLVTPEALKKIEGRLPGNFLKEIAGREGETIGSKFIFESRDFILNLIFICQQEKNKADAKDQEVNHLAA